VKFGGSLALAAAGAVLSPAVAFGGSRAVAPCRSAALRLVAAHYGEAGGQFGQTFTFTNISRRICTLAGSPSVKSSARTIRVVQGTRGTQPYRTVIPRPRSGAAPFAPFGADYDAVANRASPRTTALWVTPPRGSPMHVAVRVPNCGRFYVAPIIAGKIDRGSWSVIWRQRP
jgi:hypothetical protein